MRVQIPLSGVIRYLLQLLIMQEYGFILITIFLAMIIAMALIMISYFLVIKNYDEEKVSPYECGFDPFLDTRARFEIRFYLVAILFIIFDLEIIFLFPWAVSLSQIGLFGYYVMATFLILLIFGFVYEWLKGALEWE